MAYKKIQCAIFSNTIIRAFASVLGMATVAINLEENSNCVCAKNNQ